MRTRGLQIQGQSELQDLISKDKLKTPTKAEVVAQLYGHMSGSPEAHVTPTLGDLTLSSGLCKNLHTASIHTNTQYNKNMFKTC